MASRVNNVDEGKATLRRAWMLAAAMLFAYFYFLDVATSTVHPSSDVRIATLVFTVLAFIVSLPYGAAVIVGIYVVFALFPAQGDAVESIWREAEPAWKRLLEMFPGLIGLLVNLLWIIKR